MVTFCRNLLKGKFSPCPCHGGIQGGAEVHLRSFLTSALYGSERSALPPGKNSVTYWTGGWMGPMPRLNVSENFLLSLPRLEPRSSSPWICYFSTHFWHTKNCTTWHHVTFHRTVPSVYTYGRTPDPISNGDFQRGFVVHWKQRFRAFLRFLKLCNASQQNAHLSIC